MQSRKELARSRMTNEFEDLVTSVRSGMDKLKQMVPETRKGDVALARDRFDSAISEALDVPIQQGISGRSLLFQAHTDAAILHLKEAVRHVGATTEGSIGRNINAIKDLLRYDATPDAPEAVIRNAGRIADLLNESMLYPNGKITKETVIETADRIAEIVKKGIRPKKMKEVRRAIIQVISEGIKPAVINQLVWEIDPSKAEPHINAEHNGS